MSAIEYGEGELWGYLIPQADTGEIRALASTLANAFHALHEVSLGIRTYQFPRDWTGQAQQAYSVAMGQAFAALQQPGESLEKASGALGQFADSLDDCLHTERALIGQQVELENRAAAANLKAMNLVKQAQRHGAPATASPVELELMSGMRSPLSQAEAAAAGLQTELAELQEKARQNYDQYEHAVMSVAAALAPASGFALVAGDLGKLSSVTGELATALSVAGLIIPGMDAVVAGLETVSLAAEAGETVADAELEGEGGITPQALLTELGGTALDGALTVEGMNSGEISGIKDQLAQIVGSQALSSGYETATESISPDPGEIASGSSAIAPQCVE